MKKTLLYTLLVMSFALVGCWPADASMGELFGYRLGEVYEVRDDTLHRVTDPGMCLLAERPFESEFC